MARVRFGAVVVRANTKEDRFNTDKEFYVGGEHMDSGEFLVNKRGIIEGSNIGPMFYFGFKAGQVLLASRSPDLKKAGMVTFDGLCSEKTFVIQSKDEEVLLQSFLPAIVRSEDFWKYANDNQSGSVNHFINWSTFASYEFDLPSIEEQKKASDLLWAMERTKNAYRQLQIKTDELVKSQFIEMSALWQRDFKLKPLTCFINNITYGFTNPMPDTEEGPWKVTAKDIVDGKIDYATARKTSQEAYDALTDKSKPRIGDVLLTKDGTLGRVALVEDEGICINQSVAAIRCNDNIIPQFLASILQMPEYQEKMLADAGGVTVRHLYITRVDKMLMLIPDMSSQEEWIAFVNQSDKSKFELRKAIDTIISAQRALIKETLNQ